jgi:hypothetical protein
VAAEQVHRVDYLEQLLGVLQMRVPCAGTGGEVGDGRLIPALHGVHRRIRMNSFQVRQFCPGWCPQARPEGERLMKDGTFVLDAHTGFWDASPENTKNRFGDAFVETFYAFHTGFSPPDPKWRMDYEKEFRKIDPDWYLEHMFVKGEADMAILSTQVLMDFYHTGFVNPERNAELVTRAPERLIPLGGVDPRAPNAVEEVERQVSALGMRGFKWYTAEWRGESRGWAANDPMVFPLYEKCLELGGRNHFFHKGPAVDPLSLSKVRRAGHRRAGLAVPGPELHRRSLRRAPGG